MADGEYFTGRAQRVLKWLATQRLPKTSRQTIEAVEPTCPQANMAGTMATLARRGKVKRHKTDAGVAFSVTATAFVDERVVANQAKKNQGRKKVVTSGVEDPVAAAAGVKREQQRQGRIREATPPNAPTKPTRGPSPERLAAIGKAAEAPKAPPTTAPRARRTNEYFFLRTEVDARQPQRDALAADVAAFEAAGGVIQRLDPGASSRPLVSAQEWNEANWRARERRLAEAALANDTDE